jgi:hypothetical protein
MRKPRVEFVSYNGAYPNLCAGTLVLRADGVEYTFPHYCMASGGGVWFDKDWSEHVDSGPWMINKFPDNFPKELIQEAIDVVNDNVPYGCCGGCV